MYETHCGLRLEDSQTFKVRIVYFNAAETAGDPEVNQRLGISQYFVEPLLSPPSVKLTSECYRRALQGIKIDVIP